MDMQADVGEGIPKSLCPHLCYLHIRFSQQIERRVFYFLIKAWSLICKALLICLIFSLLNFRYKIYFEHYDDISNLVIKLVSQGFNLAALRKKFLIFYNSKLNVWSKYGEDIYDHVIKFFN